MNKLDWLPNGEIHTVIVESRNVDPDPAPSRDMEYSCLTSLVSNNERGVFGTVLRDDWYLGLSQQSLRAVSGFTWQPHTGGNILKVSYNVLEGREFSRYNGRSDNASRCIRCDSVKSRDVFISLET